MFPLTKKLKKLILKKKQETIRGCQADYWTWVHVLSYLYLKTRQLMVVKSISGRKYISWLNSFQETESKAAVPQNILSWIQSLSNLSSVIAP